MSLASVAVLLALAAPPAEAVVTVEDPAENLPRLRPFLEWASRVVPMVRPGRISWAVGVLGLDPFEASSAQWRAAGVDPSAPAQLWIPQQERVVATLRVRNDAALRTYVEKQPTVRVAEKAKDWGFVGGRADRPSLVGILHKHRVWLGHHRTITIVPKKDRVSHEAKLVDELAQAARRLSRQRAKPRPRAGPRHPPVARMSGTGPFPVADWSGALWIDPAGFAGTARFELADGRAPLAKDWVAAKPMHPLLSPEGAVFELITQADPGAVRDLLPGRPEGAARLLSGRLHAVLTQNGSLVGAFELRSFARDARVDALTRELRAADPDLKVHRAHGALVLWYPGSDRSKVARWLNKRPGTGKTPTLVRIQASHALSAIRSRDAAEGGPTLGSGKTTLLEVGYGAFLERTRMVEFRLKRARRGIDAMVTIIPQKI